MTFKEYWDSDKAAKARLGDKRTMAQAAWSAALESAALLCEEKFAGHYDHSARKKGAVECAAAIRATK